MAFTPVDNRQHTTSINSINNIALKLREFEQTNSKQRKELDLFLAVKKEGTIEQIVVYLELCKQYQEKLELICFPNTQLTHKNAIITNKKLQIGHMCDNSSITIQSASSAEPQLREFFLVNAIIQLRKSIQLIKKLYSKLEQRSNKIDNIVSQKLDLLENKVQHTYSLMMHLMRIATYMRTWSLQLLKDPKKCDLDEFSMEFVFQNKVTNFVTKNDSFSTSSEENKEENDDLLEEYKNLRSRFSRIVDACIEEERDFTVLTEFNRPGGRLDIIQQQAEIQEMTLKATHQSTNFLIKRWQIWRSNMVRHLSNWHVESQKSSENMYEQNDIEMGRNQL
ncbi:MAG: hypothetical protein CK423_07160 [Legionella sp.]|nr:MAG: hypothetical protein CK423_07160 [Legionella sp.]